MSNQRIEVLPEIDVICENPQLPFPLEEYKVRLTRIRRVMAERKIDLLYLTSPESMNYVSGLNMAWYQRESPTGIAVHVDHDKFIVFCDEEEYGLITGTTCATDIRITNKTGDINQCRSDSNCKSLGLDVYDSVMQNLKELGWLTGTVGLELGCYRLPKQESNILQVKFEQKGCQVEDGTDILVGVRRKKSAMELNYVRKASTIADIGHKTVLDQICVGMTELELVGIYTQAMMKVGGENMGIANMVRSGKGKLLCEYAPASRKLIMPGEPVGVNLAGVYNRYHANMGRCYCLGNPDEQFADMFYKTNVLLMQEVKKLLKPNMQVSKLYEEVGAICHEIGLSGEKNWLSGYELGIAFPPDWRGGFVHNSEVDDEERFESGMVVNLKTCMGVIDTVIFTENEVEILTSTSCELMIVE